jgi:hypothetical protein
MYPIPDATYTYTIRYSIYPEDLSASTDTSDLSNKDLMIVARASWYGAIATLETETAELFNSQYQDLLAKAIAADHSAEDWTPVCRGFSSDYAHRSVEYWRDPWEGR